VAVASYAAAAVANTNPWPTSIIAFRLGLAVFIIPYMFVYGPPLLGVGTVNEVIWTFISACAGIFLLAVASSGWLKIDLKVHERLLALAAALPIIYSDWRSDLVGLGLLCLMLGLLFLRLRRIRTESPTVPRAP
jgi:TRAP-type uncharacterized transport system fused permease subunit